MLERDWLNSKRFLPQEIARYPVGCQFVCLLDQRLLHCNSHMVYSLYIFQGYLVLWIVSNPSYGFLTLIRCFYDVSKDLSCMYQYQRECPITCTIKTSVLNPKEKTIYNNPVVFITFAITDLLIEMSFIFRFHFIARIFPDRKSLVSFPVTTIHRPFDFVRRMRLSIPS